MSSLPDNHPRYIVVGLPKCGTSSLTKMFLDAGIPACHHDFKHENKEVYVGCIMKDNAKQNKPLLGGLLQPFHAFLEMNCHLYNVWPQLTMLDTLTEQYPDAYYILNTRDVYAHAKSIWNWYNMKRILEFYDVPGLTKASPDGHLTLADIETWISQHNERIRDFFKRRPHLKITEIRIGEPDVVTHLEAFLGLQGLFFPHENRTTPQSMKDSPINVQLVTEVKRMQELEKKNLTS